MASEEEGGAGAPRAGGPGGPARTPVRYCAVYTCLHNYKTHPHLTYFTVPTQPKRCLKWLKRIRRMDILKNGKVSGYHRVCEVHFKPQDIARTANGARRRLLPRAAPALLLPTGDSFVAVHEPPAPAPRAPPPPGVALPPGAAPAPPRARTLAASSVEIFQYIDNAPGRPARKRPRPEPEPRLRWRPPAPPALPAALADFFAACDRHLDRNMAEFVKRIAQLRRPGGEAPSDGLLDLCGRLAAGAPAAYRLLAPALALPPPAALRRPLRLRARPPELLRLRAARLPPARRDCTVSLHVVAVRPHLYYDITLDRIIGLHEVDEVQEPWPATRCAVLAARALRGGWALPVARCCLARLEPGGLPAWTDAALGRLRAAGLRVRALVVDPAEPAARRPDVTAARPFFRVDGQKIYFTFDPPRLMRLLLGEFLKYDFHFEGTVARWADVERYRELERHKALPLSPPLPAALTPRRAAELRPRRAARLLGRALAAGLAEYDERGALGETAPATVKLILKVNDLFDVLDSPATAAGRNLAGGPPGASGETGFLSYMKSFFEGLKLRDGSGGEAPESREFTELWQISIATALALRARAAAPRRARGARSPLLDDRVAAAARRAAAGRPTCRQVLAAFDRLFVADILRTTDDEPPIDLNDFLGRANAIDAPPVSQTRFELEEEAAVRARDYRRGWRRRGGLAGAAARLLAAARRAHGGCAAAAPYLAGPPSPALLRLLRRLDAALRAALAARRQAARARLQDLLLDVHVLDCDAPCGCFPLHFLKKLFLRMRLHDILRQNQAAFKTCGDEVAFHLVALE